MAKKDDVNKGYDDSLIRPQAEEIPQEETEATADPITSRGIGLRVSEWVEVDRIAEELNVTPHSVAVEGVRFLLAELAAGRAKVNQKITTGKITPEAENLE